MAWLHKWKWACVVFTLHHQNQFAFPFPALNRHSPLPQSVAVSPLVAVKVRFQVTVKEKQDKEVMSTTILSSCSCNLICSSREQTPLHPNQFLGDGQRILTQLVAKSNRSYHAFRKNMQSPRFSVFAATEGSAKSSESDETIPSWAKRDADEPPPWARDDGKGSTSQQSFEIPFYVYLLASTITAIAAIGSIFEYVNKNPVFGILNSDSIFYTPLLGFFALTGIPTSAFLWFKSVQVANKEAEEQDRRDGYK